MAQVSFRLTIDPGAVRNAAKRAVGPVMRSALERSGKEMVAEATRLMGADFDLNRPMERRRYPGSRRAGSALDYAITGSDTDLTLGFRVLGGDEVFSRILFMNYGTRRHPITAKGGWNLKGARLAVRSNPIKGVRGQSQSFTGMLAFPGTNQFAGRYVVVESVNHPGQKGTKFLQKARDKAARDLGGRRVA